MAKRIMIQGTMSNAGKSLICAGLCRIFKQDGYKTAPFKSQNMALNSYITEEGLEIGRAQAVQAEAAGIRPQTWMNPILLKPTGDMGSQIIVNGEVLGNMSARQYFAYKKKLIPDIMRAFHKLEEEYDIIVIEGAGSPAEINLKENDIVNMGLAKMTDAPVLLVGDIDRGGVFAQLLGTLLLLEEKEKERIKGLIINKFRGDKTILEPGITMLEERSGILAAGVVPYLKVEIEDEDSLTKRFEGNIRDKGTAIKISVIRTPRISNFTDFFVFENTKGINLQYVKSVSELADSDMIILPGTKNTIEDLLWLRQNGLEAAILKEAALGTAVWGICGGYQMMGEYLKDPEGVEGAGRKEVVRGMGLLPMETVFVKEKKRTRVTGTFHVIDGIFSSLSGMSFEGYEIHMGRTAGEAGSISTIRDSVSGSESVDGACVGNICGTYVHGIFDNQDISQAVLKALAEKRGIPFEEIESVDLKEFKEQQYDLLADELRAHLDMRMIYKIMGEKNDVGRD
ncbi:cobyric acid synthase [Lachnospiraceae bacterium 42-17]|jgi:adenosylcobyric acid synthase|nr:cobyric acid synthase [Dorea sp.]